MEPEWWKALRPVLLPKRQIGVQQMKNMEHMEQTILRLREVKRMVGLSRSSIYNAIARNDFPRQISLGARAVGWVRTEVEAWVNRRIAASRGQA